MDKRIVMLGMVLGSAMGGWVPTLFGVDSFSLISILGYLLGGILGIWLSLKLVQ